VDYPPQRVAHGGVHHGREALLHLGSFSVPDRFDQQVAQAPAVERLAEDVEDLIAERLALLVQQQSAAARRGGPGR
jgi:hypothetical protein